MKRLIKLGFILAGATFMLYSCGDPYSKMLKNVDLIDASANPELLTLVGNSVSTDVTVTFPEKYFQKPIILKFTPVLVYEGGEIVGTPRYYQGEGVTENYTVVSKSMGGTYTNKVVLPYDARADISTLEMRVEGRYAEHKKAEMMEFAPFGVFPVAQGISTIQNLAQPHMVILPDNFKRITTITEEAEIKYAINSSAVRPAQLSQEQIKLFSDFVKENENKERVTLGNVYAKGYASPDGPEKFNDKLSGERSQSGEKAIKNQLKGTGVAYDAASYGEDWEGFKQLVEASNIADKNLILQVLSMYDNSARREEEIKNLSRVYDELKNSVLPELRRTQFVISADIEGKSDAELIAAVNNNDRNLNVEEMLYAATLVEGAKKAEVYKMAADKYNDGRAWNNLAVSQLQAGNVAGAKASMEKAAKLLSNQTITNNLGAIAIAEGDLAAAKRYIGALNTTDAKINKGIIAIHEGDYAAAANDLTGYNLAVAETLNGNYAKAKSALSGIDCPCADYLNAVIAMRQGDSRGAMANLKTAVAKEPKLAAKAKKDIEFVRLFNDADFQAL